MATKKKATKKVSKKKTARKPARKAKPEAPSLSLVEASREAIGSPDDGVQKLTEVEALRFGKLDAEIRNARMGMELSKHEIVRLNQQIAVIRNQVAQVNDNLEKSLQPEYNRFVSGLAKKYGIPVQRLVIDPDLGTVRDTGDTGVTT
jgi:hypothetical protein